MTFLDTSWHSGGTLRRRHLLHSLSLPRCQQRCSSRSEVYQVKRTDTTSLGTRGEDYERLDHQSCSASTLAFYYLYCFRLILAQKAYMLEYSIFVCFLNPREARSKLWFIQLCRHCAYGHDHDRWKTEMQSPMTQGPWRDAVYFVFSFLRDLRLSGPFSCHFWVDEMQSSHSPRQVRSALDFVGDLIVNSWITKMLRESCVAEIKICFSVAARLAKVCPCCPQCATLGGSFCVLCGYCGLLG